MQPRARRRTYTHTLKDNMDDQVPVCLPTHACTTVVRHKGSQNLNTEELKKRSHMGSIVGSWSLED